jgi:hypothetical protein
MGSSSNHFDNFQKGPCIRSNPTVSISPSTKTGAPSQTLTYTLTLKNNDNPGCATSTFTVNPSLPAGLSQSPASLNENLSPGATVTRTLLVTSDPNTAAGSHSSRIFTEAAANTGDSNYSASASAIYELNLPDATPPTVTIISPPTGSTLPKNGPVTISVAASDDSGINRINIYLDNDLLKTCLNMPSCKYQWNSSEVSSGTHIVRVEATDKTPTPNTGSTLVRVEK